MAVHAPELANGSCDDDGRLIRTGTLWSCIAHIITAVIGSGVLSLAWSTAQLGWIAGPVSLLCFAIVTYISVFLLSDCYRSPHPVTGMQNYCHMDAVRVNLGRKRTWVCGLFQYISLFGTGIASVITTSTCMRAIQRTNCQHKEGHQGSCANGNSIHVYMLLFGGVQTVMSQIPVFHNMELLSVIASIMSFSYSSIGLENWRIKGSIEGIQTSSTSQKLYLSFQALGDIDFAYPYSLILLEIQDTLKSPPAENKSMKKASMITILITTFFYLCCGCLGYAAFGDNAPGNLLTGSGFYEPYWLLDFANACVVFHLVGGYQFDFLFCGAILLVISILGTSSCSKIPLIAGVYSQPVFAFVEVWLMKKFPNSGFVNKFYAFKIPLLRAFYLNLLRLCFRTAYDSIIYNRDCYALPLLQLSFGSVGIIELLATGYIFPRGDVFCAKENWDLDKEMDYSSDI